MDNIFDQTLTAEGFDPADTSGFLLPGGIYSKDGDTFGLSDGRTLRLKGVNTYETQKAGNTVESFRPAEYGADTQQQIVRRAIQDNGFTIPKFSGEKDKYQRELGDLVNEKGESLSDYLLQNRLADSLMPTQQQQTGIAVADLYRDRDISNHAPTNIATAMRDALNYDRNRVPMEAKPYANTAAQYGASLDARGDSDRYAGAAYISPDETYKGEARSNFKTGLSSGYQGMVQGAWNALDILGTATGSEYLQNAGKSKSDTYKSNLANLPSLRSGEAISPDGSWNLNSLSEVADYMLGTAASSAPQMMLSVAATLAAPMTMGTSLAIPAIIYAGQTWEGQGEKKDVSWAVGSGILQSLVEAIGISKVTGSILSKATQKEVIEQMVKKGYTQEAAERTIVNKIQEGLKDVAEASALASQLSARKVGKAVVSGVVNEAPEEMIQEATQYFGEKKGIALPDDPYEMIKLKNRIINAGVGGAVLGGTFGGAGRVMRNAVTANPNATPQSSDTEFRQNMMNTFGKVETARGMIEDAESDQTPGGEPTLEELSRAEGFKRQASGAIGKISSFFKDKGLGGLFGKWSSNLAGSDSHAGGYSAALWTLLGANRAFNGGSIEEQQSHIAQELQNTFGSVDEVKRAFKGLPISNISSILSSSEVKQALLSLLGAKHAENAATVDSAVLSHGSGLDILLGKHAEHKEAITKYADKIDSLINAYNSRTGSKLTPEQFLEMKPVNKSAIDRNPSEFASLLVKHLGITQAEAQETVARLINDTSVNYLTDPFDDLFDAATRPNSAIVKDNIEAILNDPKHAGVFGKFLNQDVLENAYSLAAQGAAKYVNKHLIGNDGSKLATLIQAAVSNGELSSERASFVAHELKDWVAMRRGTYHEITNVYAKGALSCINFLSTVSSLPLAAISSTVEFAQIYRNLNLPQSIKATQALLKGFVAEAAGVFTALGGKETKVNQDYHEALFAGGFQGKGDIGRRNDIVTGYFSKWTEGFFKLTGLTSITNITRFAKMSIGADAITNWVKTVQQDDPQNPSQAAKDAREHLVRVGVNIEYLLSVDMQSEAHEARVMHEIQQGTHNFVIEAVIQPSKMNRPKFYSDPYLQLFTQFQGYTSAFTANVLPRLIKDIQKNGSQDQVNAAATIAMGMALTYFALACKDMIKYGQTPPEWLKEEKRFQRFIGQTGILGSGQRIWDTVSSVLPPSKQNQSVLQKAYSQVSDQAPALAYINKINDALSAQPGSKTKAAVRTIPVFGTSPAFAKYVQQELGDY